MFYNNVKRLCTERGISITALALTLGLSRSAPSAWRSMTKPPRPTTVKKIAEYFNVPPETLISDNPLPDKSDHDAQTKEMLRLFKQLSVIGKAKVLLYTNDIIKAEKEK